MGANNSAVAREVIETSGRAQTDRERVLGLLRSVADGLTPGEVEAACGRHVSKRLYDLRAAGLAHPDGARTCPVSGKRASVWHAGRGRTRAVTEADRLAEAADLRRQGLACLARADRIEVDLGRSARLQLELL